MTSAATALRARRTVSPAGTAEARERWARRRACLAWGLLVLNVLTFYHLTWSGMPLILPIPSILGKAITQGSLPGAFLLALSVNRRQIIRPNIFLCLVSLLVVEALITSLQAEHFGTIYRTFRLAGFLATLWMLTPWWGRRDLLLARTHLRVMSIVLGSVLAGLLISPGSAMGGGRLAGALWPTPPPQVAQFAAVTLGLVVVLWLSGLVRGRITLLAVAGAGFILLMTHTRTALIAMAAGILVAGLSLFTANARVRKAFAIGGVVVSIGAITLSAVVTTWLARGQGTQQLTELTGRTNVWSDVLSTPRNWFQVLFGFGLSNKAFNGLPIDSNWLSTYYDLGLIGVLVCATMLIFLLVAAYFSPRGAPRALALFLVTYCLVASFTETGFGDASTYLLELTLAASLIVPSAANKGGL